jgi:Flp pilus assembly protein TadG
MTSPDQTFSRPVVALPRRMRRRLVKLLRVRLLRDCRATVAIEFAFVLPILCLMVFGLYEVTEGVICYMKVVDVANTVGDRESLLIMSSLTSASEDTADRKRRSPSMPAWSGSPIGPRQCRRARFV